MENVATEEFISRTEALEDFESCNAENSNWTPQRVKTLLLRQPAADVAEVVHGRWIKDDFLSDDVNNAEKCSQCGELIGWFGKLPKYCPNCWAKMDGGNDDATD